MQNCPRCGSPRIVSNKIEAAFLERATRIAQASQAIGMRRVTALAGLGALALQGVNVLFNDCRCLDCHCKFDLD